MDPLTQTAVSLLVAGVLLVLGVLATRLAQRGGVPALLLFLCLGMAAGSEGLLGIPYEDYQQTAMLGTLALILILFDGGFNTPMSAVRQAWRPAALLATFGVVGTAGGMALAAWWCGLDGRLALLLGAIISSTDAAAVFNVLRGSRLNVHRRLASTLELESGANDPLAVILTVSTIGFVQQQMGGWGWLLASVVWQLAMGLGLGWLCGHGALRLIRALPSLSAGVYPVLSVGIALSAYAACTLLGGSGFLAVYTCAVVLGQADLPHPVGLRRAHDALAWISQVALFLLLGLLVFPSRLWEAAPLGLLLGVLLAFVVRPLAVMACVVWCGFRGKELLFLSWVGLRGAVPILLATLPVLAGVDGARTVFDLVAVMVVVSAIIPGATVPWLTRTLGLQQLGRGSPPPLLELDAPHRLGKQLHGFIIHPVTPVAGVGLAQVPFPDGARVLLVVRQGSLLTPRGSTVLQVDDHVYVLSAPEDIADLVLLFGNPQDC